MDYLPAKLQGDMSLLWQDAGTSGLNLDPRKIRSGGTFMPPSAICGSYSVVTRKTVVRDPYLGTVSGDQVKVHFTYIKWPGIEEHIPWEGTRFETVASWQRSVLEHKRQVLKMAALSDPCKDLLNEARSLWLEKKEELLKLYMSQFYFIKEKGDWSEEQFERYARLHKKSGMGMRKLTWGAILKDPLRFRECYSQYFKATSDLLALLIQDKFYDGEHTIHPQWTYPALRSRPGDQADIKVNDGVGDVIVTKHRDRAAGGVYGMSQLMWPIFETDHKRFLANLLVSEISRIVGLKLITPEVEGVKAYQSLLDEDPDNIVLFDTSLAERLESFISDLPTAANLSIPGFEKRYGQKKFSGISLTRNDQYFTEPFLILAAIKLGYLSKSSHYYFGGDNWGCISSEPIPKEIEEVLAPSERWLGHSVLHQNIPGFKVTIDSADDCATWTDRQNKFGFNQTRSGIARLTRVLVSMNLIPDLMTFKEFLDKVARSDLDNIDLHDGAPYHNVLEDSELMKRFIEQTPDFAQVCEDVLKLSESCSVPYKLINDTNSPVEPSYGVL